MVTTAAGKAGAGDGGSAPPSSRRLSVDLPSKIAASDDLHIAPLRDDGETYGTSTWIWSALVDGALYVSACDGKASRWNQAAKLRGTVQSC
jgi:hypothetical protein